MSRVEEYLAQIEAQKKTSLIEKARRLPGKRRARFALSYLILMLVLLIAVEGVGESYSYFILLVHMSYIPMLIFPVLGLIFAASRTNIKGIIYNCCSLGIVLYLMNPIWFHGDREPNSATIQVMTFNIQDAKAGKIELVAAMKEFSPDVVLLQEASVLKSDISLRDQITEGYTLYLTENIGILSKFPVDELTEINFEDLLHMDQEEVRKQFAMEEVHHQYGQIAKITWNGQTIRIVNTHLSPIAYLPIKMNWKQALGLLKPTDDYRTAQITALKEQLAGLEGPIIFGGDLNTPGMGRQYGRLREGYQDSWREVGNGFGWTFPAERPYGRYDQLYSNDFWQSDTARIGSMPGSDHRSYLVKFNLIKPWKLEESSPRTENRDTAQPEHSQSGGEIAQTPEKMKTTAKPTSAGTN